MQPGDDNIENEESLSSVMTSAITDMSVAEVRKALSYMRKEWSRHSCVMPFFTSQELPNSNMSVAEFSFRFVMGHHHKRHQKNLPTA